MTNSLIAHSSFIPKLSPDSQVSTEPLSASEFALLLAQHTFFASSSSACNQFDSLSEISDLSSQRLLGYIEAYAQLNPVTISAKILADLPRVSQLCFAIHNDKFVVRESLANLAHNVSDLADCSLYFLSPQVPARKLTKQQFVQIFMQGQWIILLLLLFIGVPPVVFAALAELLEQPLFDTFVPEGRIPSILLVGLATILFQLTGQVISSVSSLYQEYFNVQIDLETKIAAAQRFLSAQARSLPERDAGSWRVTFSVASAFLGSLQSVAVSIPLAIISMVVNVLVVGAFVDFNAVWNLFLILLIPTAITLVMSYISSNISIQLIGQQSRLDTIIYDVVRQVRGIWLLNIEENYIQRFQVARKQMADSLIKSGMIEAASNVVNSVFQGLLYAFIFYQYYRSVTDNAVNPMSPGSLLVIYFALGTISGSLASISQDFVSIAQSLPTYWMPNALRDISAFRAEQSSAAAIDCPDEIRINELIYTVQDQPIPFPRPLSFVLNTGYSYAIVGPSGAGKSTLLRLLIGNLQPTAGEIQLIGKNGVNLRHQLDSSKILYLSQEVNLYGSTLRDVVDPVQAYSVDQLEAACDQINLTPVLDALPLRWKTPVNEYSRDLSLGQLQLFKLTRCLLDDYDIILSDEPTCHLPEDQHKNAIKILNSRSKLHLSVLHRQSALSLFDAVLAVTTDGDISLSSTAEQ